MPKKKQQRTGTIEDVTYQQNPDPWTQRQLHLLAQNKLKGDKSYWFSFMNPGVQAKYKDNGRLTDDQIVADYGRVILSRSIKKDRDALRRVLIDNYRQFNNKDPKIQNNLAEKGLTFNYMRAGGGGSRDEANQGASLYRKWAKDNGIVLPKHEFSFFGSVAKGWSKAPKSIEHIAKDAPAQIAGLVKAATDVKTIAKGWKLAEKQMPEAFESVGSYFKDAIPDAINITGKWYEKQAEKMFDWATYYAEDISLIAAGPVLFLVLLVIE